MENELKNLRLAARQLSLVPAEERSKALRAFAASLRAREAEILSANAKDIEAFQSELAPAARARLKLDASKLAIVARGIESLADVPDPVGRILERTVLDDGLVLDKVQVPLGVVGIIFESRPDVFPQIVSLALRSGNAVALKGGKESRFTNEVQLRCYKESAGKFFDVPEMGVVLSHDRAAVRAMIDTDQYLDLVIPRGSKEFVQQIMRESKVPVLGHAEGVCHIFVEQTANLKRATEISVDAKVQYPAACNAVETVLVEQRIANAFLEEFLPAATAANIRLKGCDKTRLIAPEIEAARDSDYFAEYGDTTLNLKIVEDLEAAIAHINHYGSHHTDSILSENTTAIERFLAAVDSACVFSNCSTRLSDGYRFGLGAEIGIGTGRIHARGPVGIEGILTYKYILRGSGQRVSEYVGEGAKPLLHQRQIPH